MGERSPIGEENSAEAKAGEKPLTKNPELLAVGFLVLIWLGYFWVHEQHAEIASQKSKIDALETELKEKEYQILALTDELLPLRDYAVSKFGGGESQALAQLAKDIQTPFRPLDAASRKKVIASFSAVQTQFGTNLTSVELVVETTNINCSLLADEWVSILKDAGFKAVVRRRQIDSTMDTRYPVLFECNRDQGPALRAFVNAMLEFPIVRSFGGRNVAQAGVLTVHIFGEPYFSPDGHVTLSFGETLGIPGRHYKAIRSL